MKYQNQILSAFEFDATESPDLFPPLVALASYCKGISVIKGVSRLKYKESDRAKTLQEEFGKLNIKIEIREDLMYITGGQPQGGKVESHDDHRIAMALAVTSLRCNRKCIHQGLAVCGKVIPWFL